MEENNRNIYIDPSVQEHETKLDRMMEMKTQLTKFLTTFSELLSSRMQDNLQKVFNEIDQVLEYLTTKEE